MQHSYFFIRCKITTEKVPPKYPKISIFIPGMHYRVIENSDYA